MFKFKVTPGKLITEKSHNEVREKDQYYGKQYKRHEKPTLVLQQVQLSEPKVIQRESFIAVIDAIKTPTSVKEALEDENWIQAINKDIRLVVKRNAQTYGIGFIGYEETFSPIAKMNMLRIFLSLAVHLG
ncbi:hypothetical protein CR513_33475, partial [Mucuna pruriens]